MGQSDLLKVSHMKPNIVWLDRADGDVLPLIGGKAATLARLHREGYPIPAGFCVTTDAYRQFMGNQSFPGPSIDSFPRDGEVSNFIVSAPMPSAIRLDLEDAYEQLCRQHGPKIKLAVRSSAIAEDLPVASFAGQYVSVLGVESLEGVLEAVRKCWVSSFSVGVQSYKTVSGLDKGETAVAVIVQLMILAEVSGVLFTVDPLSKNSNRIVMDLTEGLGDKVVAGTQSGVHLEADRATCELINLGDRKWANLSVGNVNWSDLIKMALRIERLMGGPQDIEWAYANQEFWILQSRHITVLSEGKPRQIWSRANAGEIMPGVVSPLTWSIFKPLLQAAGHYRSRSPFTIHWRWSYPHLTAPDSPRLICGRAYMELSSVYMGFGSMPGVSPEILQRVLGFELHLLTGDELPQKHFRWHIKDPYRYLRFWLEVHRITKSLSREAERHLYWKEAIDYRSRANEVQILSGNIMPQIEKLLDETARVLGLHIQCTSMAFSVFGLLDRVLRRHLTDPEVDEFEAGLTAEFQEISTVEQSVAIWELARAAVKVPFICDTLLKIDSADELVEIWKLSPAAPDFLRLWDAFMSRFGDRGSQEFELAVAHWAEDPTMVVKTMRQIIMHQLPDPREQLKKRRDAWNLQCTRVVELIRSNGSLRDLWSFRKFIRVYGDFVSLRENLKYRVVGKFRSLREIFLALGRALVKRKLLFEYQDIFFLSYQEICQLLNQPSGYGFDLKALIRERKKTHEEYARSHAPDLWISVEGNDVPVRLEPSQRGSMLNGVGCSPGVATGPAHVFSSMNYTVLVQPGSIIVTNSIDPGMTPLFLTSAGLVTEIGGTLSHGATVAREYGLPAVVGVPHATEIIRTGQQITVDGYTGVVHMGPIEE